MLVTTWSGRDVVASVWPVSYTHLRQNTRRPIEHLNTYSLLCISLCNTNATVPQNVNVIQQALEWSKHADDLTHSGAVFRVETVLYTHDGDDETTNPTPANKLTRLNICVSLDPPSVTHAHTQRTLVINYWLQRRLFILFIARLIVPTVRNSLWISWRVEVCTRIIQKPFSQAFFYTTRMNEAQIP